MSVCHRLPPFYRVALPADRPLTADRSSAGRTRTVRRQLSSDVSYRVWTRVLTSVWRQFAPAPSSRSSACKFFGGCRSPSNCQRDWRRRRRPFARVRSSRARHSVMPAARQYAPRYRIGRRFSPLPAFHRLGQRRRRQQASE